MKRKNWKRTAAFVTSLTMATTMMPAELGSVLVKAVEDPNKAPEIATLNWATTKYDTNSKSFITKIKVNDVEQTNIISNRDMEFAAGSKVAITSKVPLKFFYLNANTAGTDKDKDKDNNSIEGDNTFFLSCANYGVTRTVGVGGNPDTYKRTEDNEPLDAETAKAAVLTAAGYDVADETFTAVWNGENVEVTFAAKETQNSDGSYTYSFTMPDDNDISTADSVTVGVFKRDIKVNFYKDEETREADQQTGNNRWTEKQTGAECDDYFGQLEIKPSSGTPAAKGYANVKAKTDKLNDVIVGDTVTVTNDKPFIVRVSDGNDKNEWIEGSYSFDPQSGKYNVEFTMPDFKGANTALDKSIVVDIIRIEETYSYRVSGSNLVADSTNTEAVRNLVAAGIVAKYYEAGDHPENFGLANDDGKEIDGVVPNGATVVVEAGKVNKLTGDDAVNAFSVTKNNAAIAAADGTVAGKKFTSAGKAGTYDVTYKVTGKDGNTYNLSYSFRIASKDELTAEDVKLTISAKKDNNATNIGDIMLPDEIVKNDLENGKVVNFMLQKDKDEAVANANYQFTVQPTFAAALGLVEGTDYYVQGYTSGSTINSENPYEFTIFVTNPEYGGSVANPKKIKIKWNVVGYDEIPRWNQNNRFGPDVATPDASISIDNLGENSINLKKAIFAAANANGAANTALESNDSKLKFQYIKAPGALRTKERQDELDVYEDDKLPSELGDYTVYVVYDGVVETTVDVHITKYALDIFADASDLTFKYGHKFELTQPTVQKNIEGDTVDIEISNLTCTIYEANPVLDANGNVTSYEEGNALAGKADITIDQVGQLNAGHYFVEFNGNSSNEDYSVTGVPQEITVNKKALNDPSLVILIDPFTYDGTTKDVVKDRASNFTVRDTDFAEGDPRYIISDFFKMTEGDKRSDVGAYNCNFQLVNEVKTVTQANITDATAEANVKLAAYNTASATYTTAEKAYSDAYKVKLGKAAIKQFITDSYTTISEAADAATAAAAVANDNTAVAAAAINTCYQKANSVLSVTEETDGIRALITALNTKAKVAKEAKAALEADPEDDGLNTAYATAQSEYATSIENLGNSDYFASDFMTAVFGSDYSANTDYDVVLAICEGVVDTVDNSTVPPTTVAQGLLSNLKSEAETAANKTSLAASEARQGHNVEASNAANDVSACVVVVEALKTEATTAYNTAATNENTAEETYNTASTNKTNARTAYYNAVSELERLAAFNGERSSYLTNFEGRTMAGKWYITAEKANDAYLTQNVTFDAGLTWIDSKTTLYDNGKIHLEVTRNADDKIRSDKKVAKIAKFGVIVDKEGKLEAPVNYGVDYNATKIAAMANGPAKTAAIAERDIAEQFLTLGNGFLEGGYDKNTTPLTCASKTYKVNIKVKDIETGIWTRPYVLYEDGTVSYGDVKYLDLTDEAIERLQLATADVSASGKAVRKADLNSFQTGTAELIMSNVKSGYNTSENKFYVYTRYVDLEKAGFTNVAEVADFGIVADREGKFASTADIADVKKNLKKETAKVVGHYDKSNAVLGVNEYAASIKLDNSDTGLWVRSYIDLGNGLVIYDDPMYIKSASEYYGVACAGTFNTVWEKKDDNNFARLVFTQNELAKSRIKSDDPTVNKTLFAAKAGVAADKVEIVNTGVVADKNNLLDKTNKMVLNAGFINGSHKGDIEKEKYSAKLTPNGTNNVSVRTYTTYKIKGDKKDVEVTVYGPVKIFNYNATLGRVVIN